MPKSTKNSFKCNVCDKLYTSESWYLKHISICGIGIVNNNPKPINSKQLKCQNCDKIFSKCGWLERHYKTSPNCLPSKTHVNDIAEDSSNFNFSNDYFRDLNECSERSIFCDSDLNINETFRQEYSWLDQISLNKIPSNFTIIHLNLNSIFNKFEHIFSILNTSHADVIMLNEVKLDSGIPSKLYQHHNYNLLRLDRTRHGGGILVYIKKCYKIVESKLSDKFELIFFKLLINKTIYSFISTYKPPNVQDEYLEYLETFIYSNNLNNSTFIIGDLNLDLLSKNGNQLVQFMRNVEFKNFINEPTRIAPAKNGNISKTLIDVVLHNKENIVNTSVIDFPYSDHKLVLVNCKFKSITNDIEIKLSRKLNEKLISEIGKQIELINFNILDKVKNLNERWFLFKQIILNLINNLAPLKKCENKKVKNLPWYDTDLIKAERKCSKLYVKYKKDLSSVLLKAKFFESRQLYQTLLRKKKIEYYSNSKPKDFSNSKKFWQFYQTSMHIRSDKSSKLAPSCIKTDAGTVVDKNKIANEFNSFFSSFVSEQNVSSEDCKRFSYKNFQSSKFKSKLNSTFKFRNIFVEEVEKLLNSLENSASPGVSELPITILKAGRKSILPFLTKLFNDCIDSNQFIDEWKLATVTPLHKKGAIDDMNNYRGISILPPVSKIFEKILAEQIKDYFLKNDLLFEGQHGFRSFHSCETALHELISKCQKSLDKKLITILLFIDFKKAFDMICRDLLIYKLLNYGFGNEALDLIKSYFSKRSQRVKIGKFLSSDLDLNLGVPQGSVLGPLFFIIFINDLPEFLNNIYSKLFADDTTLVFDGSNLVDCNTSLKNGIIVLNEWCKHNRLYINWSKTFVMYITNKRVELPKSVDIINQSIEVVDSFVLLGVTLDNKLNFDLFVAQQ